MPAHLGHRGLRANRSPGRATHSYKKRAASLWLTLAISAFAVLGEGTAMSASANSESIPYVDLHVDLPYQHNTKGAPFLVGTGQFRAEQAPKGGLSAVVLPLFIPVTVSPEGPRVSDYEDCWRSIQEALKHQSTYAEVGSAAQPGQVRTYYSFEGMASLEQEPEKLAQWVERGVRLFGLVHNQHNALASSSMDRHVVDYGLTERGRRVVLGIYELGGVVDISHASDRAAREIIEMAQKLGRPVVATHSNARRLMNHPRNLPDELLDGVAKTGGVVGINFHSAFLVPERRATLADVVKQIVYVTKRIGVEHVAIGSDFEGGIRAPRGLANLGEVQRLVPALKAAGLGDADVRAILGGNALRILAP